MCKCIPIFRRKKKELHTFEPIHTQNLVQDRTKKIIIISMIDLTFVFLLRHFNFHSLLQANHYWGFRGIFGIPCSQNQTILTYFLVLAQNSYDTKVYHSIKWVAGTFSNCHLNIFHAYQTILNGVLLLLKSEKANCENWECEG